MTDREHRIAISVTGCDPNLGIVDSLTYPLQLTPESQQKLESIIESVAGSRGYSGWALTIIEESK